MLPLLLHYTRRSKHIMPKDTIERINELANRGDSKSKEPTPIEKTIKDEAEKIVEYLDSYFPEQFQFNTDREAYMCIGARRVIHVLKNVYLKER